MVNFELFVVGRPPVSYDLLWPVVKRAAPVVEPAVQAIEDAGILIGSGDQESYSPGAHSSSAYSY